MIRHPPDSSLQADWRSGRAILPSQLLSHGGAGPNPASVLRFTNPGEAGFRSAWKRPDQLAPLIASGDSLWVRPPGTGGSGPDPPDLPATGRVTGPACKRPPITRPSATRVDGGGRCRCCWVIHRLGFCQNARQLISETGGLLLLPNLLISLEECPSRNPFPSSPVGWPTDRRPSREDLDDVLPLS